MLCYGGAIMGMFGKMSTEELYSTPALTPIKEQKARERDFRRRMIAGGFNPKSATAEACRLVMVEQMTAYQASQQAGVDQAAVSRALAKLRKVKPVDECPHCGHSI